MPIILAVIVVLLIILVAAAATVHEWRYRENHRLVMSYLKALYPQSGYDGVEALTSAEVLQLYDSLDWYYLPLVRDIDKSRRGPVKGPYADASTQWFMADGADCGDSSSPGSFTCSVSGETCTTWEWDGDGKKRGGRPYQYVCMIEPYGRRGGSPSNAYIECVAFVCESLGRMLLTAGPDKKSCSKTAPDWQTYLANANAGKVKDWPTNVQPVKGSFTAGPALVPGRDALAPPFGPVDLSEVSCPMAGPREGFAPFGGGSFGPDLGPIGGSTVRENMDDGPQTNPCGYSGCDITKRLGSGGCDWFVSDNQEWSPWRDWLKAKEQPTVPELAEFIVEDLQNCEPSTGPAGDARPPPAPPRPDIPMQKTMFYWCKGYGRFLNMGRTGVYFQYFHYLLTAPKYAAKTDNNGNLIPIRWSFPQLLKATMEGGYSELGGQLEDLMSGKYTDNRQYLQGYVTTLRGKEYEGYISSPGDGGGAIPVANQMPFNTENTGGLINPLDDDNLVEVDNLTVTKYYDPDAKIKNPQYGQKIAYSPYNAVYLLQGMHIYGATANATNAAYVSKKGRQPEPGSWGAGVYPFGVHFAGANLGHCVYQLTALCGWDSTQFTQMPTGAGGKKYCNSPEYDYEIVFIGDKQDACLYDFKMLDPVQDWKNYLKYGFVQGTGDKDEDKRLFYTAPLDATKMRLTERNVPDDWVGPFPNAAAYDQPKEFIPDTSRCPYDDGVMNPWAKNHGGGINPFWLTGS
jgi:hypothetical protein